MSDTETDRQKYVKDTRIACKYGTKCYQKNPLHLQKYKHPPKKQDKLDVKKIDPAKRRRSPSPKQDQDNSSDSHSSEEEAKRKKIDLSKASLNSKPEDTNIANSDSENESLTENQAKDDKEIIPNFNSATENSKNIELLKDINKNKESDNSEKVIPKPKPSTSVISDLKQFIKEKFLMDMPPDFYQFWEFCKSLNEKLPEHALKEFDLTLVGPYDILAGKFDDISEKRPEEYLIHWRYYYDPPEFQTVLKGSDKTGFHIGYFRDSPDEMPVFLASNCSKQNGELSIVGDNIFGAVHTHLERLKSTVDPFKRISIEKILKKLKEKAEELKLDLDKKTQKIRQRESKIVTRSFNKMGIVVPYNKKTQVGYRNLGVSNKEFSKLLTKIKEALPEQQKKHLSELQSILTGVSIATDECDFGTSIELGLDILAYGIDSLDSTALRYLATGYRLLQKEAFAKIAEAHLKNRRKGTNLSILI